MEIIVNIIFLEGKMGTRRYIISDASKMLKVESHVLRYWEEELEIMEKVTLIVQILIQSTLEIFLTNQRVKKIHFIKKMKKDVIMV